MGQEGTGRRMIARTWRGWASAATADEYQHHYESEVAEHLRQISGFSAPACCVTMTVMK
jgi:hypothetical protein